jgi:hypothetical protein
LARHEHQTACGTPHTTANLLSGPKPYCIEPPLNSLLSPPRVQLSIVSCEWIV